MTGEGGGQEDEETASGAEDDESESVPLSGLAERVNERRGRADDDSFETAFAETPFEGVDPDSLWDDPGTESTFGAVGEVVEEDPGTFVASKRNFCERCRYFSEPPEVTCTHEGTEIREFVDKDRVRVYACPIVGERGLLDDA